MDVLEGQNQSDGKRKIHAQYPMYGALGNARRYAYANAKIPMTANKANAKNIDNRPGPRIATISPVGKPTKFVPYQVELLQSASFHSGEKSKRLKYSA